MLILRSLWMVAAIWGAVSAHAAETNSAKALFVVRVEALRPVAPTHEAGDTTGKTEAKEGVGKPPGSSSETQSEEVEFALKTETAEGSMELRSQQIEAMNGSGLIREGRGAIAPGTSGGMTRAIDFLLPKGKQLLSRNPNARRDPLRLLEE